MNTAIFPQYLEHVISQGLFCFPRLKKLGFHCSYQFVKHLKSLTSLLLALIPLLTVNLEPSANCVRLDEFTEVVVSPKTRNFPLPKNVQQTPVPSTKTKTQRSNQSHEISDGEPQHSMTSVHSAPCPADGNNQLSETTSSLTDSEEQTMAFESGLMSRFSGYLRTLFYTHDEESVAGENQSLTQKETTSNEGNLKTFASSQIAPTLDGKVLEETDFHMCLRVQPTHISKSTSINYYSLQPLVVFVDFASLPSLVLKLWTCNLESFPPPDGTIVKTVQISKLLSPKERAALRTSSTTTNSRENVSSRTRDPTPNTEVTEASNGASQGNYD